ncbi:MAG: 50S ribosomal protein L11 methyltransferase [Flavobacteriaceae bacterium]|nr:50S ribosomal protein L11 methyltransferase [Flavobacteriaceae bacterium]
MTPVYLEYSFVIEPRDPATEILIAELGYAGFESFVENESGVVAYIQKQEFFDAILNDIMILQNDDFKIDYTTKEIEQVNWNEEWEKNFDPIVVDDTCTVRAPFHEIPNTAYDIVIEPKMSFGTGHHETTHMMIQHLLEIYFHEKKTLDMGCGTGILAILAEMKGAQPIDAIDIDNWCFINTEENAERNGCQHISAYQGDATLLEGKTYNLIIANINRNILLQDIPTYVACLHDKGTLLLSGFYKEDIALITEICSKNGLAYVKNFERNNWLAVKYTKI